MSAEINAIIGGHERIAYTVEHRGNCVLITGAVPARAMVTLTKLVSGDAVMSQDVARMYGATFAFGPKEELQELRKFGAAIAEIRERAAHPGLSAAAIKWLAHGERGVSSNAIFSHLTGVDATGMSGFDVPWDPSDFRRCRLLLEQVPEIADRIGEMRSVSPAWAGIVDHWSDICRAMDEEAPYWREPVGGEPTDKTYELIKRATGQ